MTTRQLAAPTTRFALADGSLWSHAASLGRYFYSDAEDEVLLTPDLMAAFVRNFAKMPPGKVPVDYNHASTSNDPIARRARYEGGDPRAGSILELRGVTTPDELPETAALQLAAQGMTPDQGAGLWMRWKPTTRALTAVSEGEYTELSIAFWPTHDTKTGEDQGPTLHAVALLNIPFLKDMPSVAASANEAAHTHRRADDPPPADDARDDASPTADAFARHSQRGTMKFFASLSATARKPVTNEDEATAALDAITADVATLRADAETGRALGALIPGATPDAKAAHVRELTAKAAESDRLAAEARAREFGAIADATLAKYATKLVPARAEATKARLLRELSAGVAVADTETVADLEAMTPHGLTTQVSGGDLGVSLTDEARQQLAITDATAKELSALPPTATDAQRNMARERAILSVRASA